MGFIWDLYGLSKGLTMDVYVTSCGYTRDVYMMYLGLLIGLFCGIFSICIFGCGRVLVVSLCVCDV
jgi:hypothetical protein